MTLYARSDLMSVSIPETSGGCGATHSRPVTRGAPDQEFKLNCPRCESHLRGEGKPKIIKVSPGDKDLQIPSRMEHVADADPHWSITPEGVPLTPDEQTINKKRQEIGKEQLEMLRTFVALQGVPGLDLQDFAAAKWVLDRTLDPLKQPLVIKGTTVCANGHDNTGGVKFCGECGTLMPVRDAAGAIGSAQDLSLPLPEEAKGNIEVPLPLGTLHVATLKKMARERNLSDKGSKLQLIERLTT